MTKRNYQFRLIVDVTLESYEQLFDIADVLGEVGCLDASIGGYDDGIEAIFNRESPSLDAAIHSAITAIEGAVFAVKRVEMDRENFVVGTSRIVKV